MLRMGVLTYESVPWLSLEERLRKGLQEYFTTLLNLEAANDVQQWLRSKLDTFVEIDHHEQEPHKI